MAIEITRETIVQNLWSDPSFAIDFALANSREAIKNNIEGILATNIEDTDENLKGILADWYNAKDTRFINALNVPYDNGVNNWTGGLVEYFAGTPTTKSAEESGSGGFWGSLLSGIGAFATSFGSVLSGGTSGGGLTPEQIAAMQQAQAEAEAKRKQQNTIIIFAVLVLLIGGAITIYLVKKKKK